MNFIPFEHLPPEVAQAIRDQHERQHMSAEEHIHAVKQLLDGLTADGLRVLRSVIEASQDPEVSGHYQGRIVALMQIKFNVCPCGVNHEEDAKKLLEEGRELANQRDDLVASGADPEELAIPLAPEGVYQEVALGELSEMRKIVEKEAAEADVPRHIYKAGHSGMVCDELVMRDEAGDSCGLERDHPAHFTDDELMVQWGLSKVEWSDGETSIQCNGCGQKVSSLEDRMLRPPGVKGCETCQHKERWG